MRSRTNSTQKLRERRQHRNKRFDQQWFDSKNKEIGGKGGGEDLFGAILDHGDDEARPLPFLLHESFLLLLLQKWAGGRQEKAAFFISFQGEKAWASDDAISWAFEAHLSVIGLLCRFWLGDGRLDKSPIGEV